MASSTKKNEASSCKVQQQTLTGNSHAVDPNAFKTLIQEHDKALANNLQGIAQQEEYQEEYKALRGVLKSLPDKLSYEALVPVGPLVMAPGRLIHTNEILCHMGDNWFVECSATSALKLVAHRLQKSDEMKAELEKEKELIKSWRKETEREMNERVQEGTVEITEKYDESEEAEWRKQHRVKVKKHYQGLAKNKSMDSLAESRSNEEDDLWAKLDQREIEEELAEYENSKSIKAAVAGKSVSLAQPDSLKTHKTKKNTGAAAMPRTNETEIEVLLEKLASLKSTETFETKNQVIEKKKGSEKKKVSFDTSKDSVRTYLKEEESLPEFCNALTSSSFPSEPVATDSVKELVIERNPTLIAKTEGPGSSSDNPPERVSLFKQTPLSRDAGAGDGSEVSDSRPKERVSLFKQRQMESERQQNE